MCFLVILIQYDGHKGKHIRSYLFLVILIEYNHTSRKTAKILSDFFRFPPIPLFTPSFFISGNFGEFQGMNFQKAFIFNGFERLEWII